MLSKFSLPLAGLLAIASAAPHPQVLPPTVDWVTIIQPTVKLADSPLNGKLVNAADGSFYIGKAPTTTCVDTAACDTFSNKTTIAFSSNFGTGNLSVAAPGGQYAYVLPTGEFEYTAPGAVAPAGAISNRFRRWENFPPSWSIYATIGFGGGQWFACPTEEEDVYQVLAAAFASGTGCTAFEMHADEISDKSPQAYEFTV